MSASTLLGFIIFGLVSSVPMRCLMDVFSKERKISEFNIQCDECKASYLWFQHLPLINIITGRNCRCCKKHLRFTYPIMQLINAGLYVLVAMSVPDVKKAIIYCLATSALLTLSVVDWRIYEIPIQINYFIFVLGLINMLLDLRHWVQYVIGFFAVSGLLFLIVVITKGRGMGGGDVKLMATAGLLIGWKLILLPLMIGSILGSIIHLSIMKIKKAERVLAFGPYLSMGIIIAMIWGEQLISWYLSMLVVPEM